MADVAGLDQAQLSALRRVLGAAVSSAGPRKFLAVVPLQLPTASAPNGSMWVLTVLRQVMRACKL